MRRHAGAVLMWHRISPGGDGASGPRLEGNETRGSPPSDKVKPGFHGVARDGLTRKRAALSVTGGAGGPAGAGGAAGEGQGWAKRTRRPKRRSTRKNQNADR